MSAVSTHSPAGMGSVLAVVAHPDDESFGLGAILDAVVAAGGRASVLCFTRGEASTLGAEQSDLAAVRAREFAAAAAILGVTHTELLDYADGGLSTVDIAELADHVIRTAATAKPTHLLVFDTTGVTGHPDHIAATCAARTAGERLRLPVIGWALPDRIAAQLNAELGTAFAGRLPSDLAWTIHVDRRVQRRAIAAHASQANDNPVLARRLDLLGDAEHLRLLPDEPPPGPAALRPLNTGRCPTA
jgi:LmbE family N-acetylglucosaminyl deacetylase